MANITKQSPVGIDKWIQDLQNAIYNNFLVELGLVDIDWNSYGRIYRLFDADGKEYLPQPFDNGIEYGNPILFEDTVKLQTFFDILETQKIDSACQSSMHVVLYCFCNLEGIFGANVDRLDEKLSSMFASFVQQQFGFNLHSKRIGIKEIMKDWSGYGKINASEANMQPNYAFALEFEISEYYTCYSSPTTASWEQPLVPLIPYTRLKPTGIDQWIQNCQINIYNFGLNIFNLGALDYDCFGRIYRLVGKDKEYIPKAFVKMATSGSWEYTPLMFDDTKAIQTFFDVGETMREESDSLLTYSAVRVFFFLDLSKLYPTAPTSERFDEECIVLFAQFLMENSGFEMTAIQRGIKSIMSEYSGYKIKANSKANMQPFLCFRCDMKKYFDESLDTCASIIPSGREHEFDPQQFNPDQFA